MKKNMGSLDKLVRIVIAAIIISLYFMHTITGVTAIVLLSVSAIFILTSFMGSCLLYLPFGITTKSRKG